ncbi:hypothetical protein DAPPUDRAFT_318943 [Daphnia pulex]|uniref:Uncharacterized protein n=1 Tax=Daphnia pulex TaxID=6669 RepID=E9GK74_DAPPU|nr:hypothetical protein DAPPUDRAFT_318943 [Daphnia pulex]|eukprot:EFX79939.1 hypothetical protein DAPPUDRAFT_318943 [Daphnia pulex]
MALQAAKEADGFASPGVLELNLSSDQEHTSGLFLLNACSHTVLLNETSKNTRFSYCNFTNNGIVKEIIEIDGCKIRALSQLRQKEANKIHN